MVNLKDLECPRDCPGRSKTCHAECKRHEKYRAVMERRRQERYMNNTVSAALAKNINKAESRFPR